MKKSLLSILLMALLVACNEKNAPVESEIETTGVYVMFYATSLIYDNCDIKFYYVNNSGDSVEIPSAERTTPLDTAGEDRLFYYKLSRYTTPLFMPLSEFKVFKTTQPVVVPANGDSCSVFVRGARNNNPLTTGDNLKYCYIMTVASADDNYDLYFWGSGECYGSRWDIHDEDTYALIIERLNMSLLYKVTAKRKQ